MARTEALIRGYGSKEAVERLTAYSTDADILLPHTRTVDILKTDIFDLPCAIVPTKFAHFKNNTLFDMGYSMVIWANQTERIKIKATREGLKSLKDNDCAFHIEEKLSATLEDLKGLTPND